MPRIPFDQLRARIEAVLLRAGMPPNGAALSAELTAATDRDGVRTHGVARLPRFLEMVKLGSVDIHAEPEVVASFGAMERWTGHLGPGNLAAHAAMSRACELAKANGVGCVALADTTHWMRAGSYGWLAAELGCAGMCWTNIMPNLPAWGAKSPTLGNNPLVFSVPRANGEHVVLDFAMSQFSYGTLASYSARAEQLPFAGGFDSAGVLTTDPAAIEASSRALPVGFWKGSGLSFVLDVLAAMLSGGKLTADIPADPLRETGVSQVFLAIAPDAFGTLAQMDQVVARAIAALHEAEPVDPQHPPRYPGESVLAQRRDSMKNGVLIEDTVWETFQQLEPNP